MKIKKMIINYLGLELNNIFKNISEVFLEDVEEIRLRINKPIIIYKENHEYTVNKDGEIKNDLFLGYKPSNRDISKTIELMSGFSIYAFEEEIKSGFLTLQGGHRIGITGKVTCEDRKIITIKNINGINIRISHEVKNCSDEIMRFIAMPDVKHTMIISPPCTGKTTLLRDIVRNLSDGQQGLYKGQTVGVVDERSEIAGCFMGIPQNDVGARTDVLDGCPKEVGMKILLRSMSPKIIAVDEIGSDTDIYAIDEIINGGIKVICTVHGKNIADIKQRPVLNKLLAKNIFEVFIVLGYAKKPGTVVGVYDKNYSKIN